MYRDELAAAHTQNDILRRRISELEGAVADSDDPLIELVARGRQARIKQREREARAHRAAAEEARREAAREELLRRRGRAERLRESCRRANPLRHAHVPCLAGFTVLMCLIPVVIVSPIGRWIILPITGLAIGWPLVALIAHAAVNRDCVGAEKHWLGALPFPLARHFETLEADLERSVTIAVRHRGAAPSASIAADVIAALAESRRDLTGQLLELTAVRSRGDQLQLTTRFVDGDATRNQQYRMWSRAVVEVLDRLSGHFPAAAAEVMEPSS